MGNGARKAELIDFSQGQLDGNRPSIDWRLPWDSWRIRRRVQRMTVRHAWHRPPQ